MQQTSLYCIECLCGRQLETDQRKLECPVCGRELRIEWNAEIKTADAKPELNRIPAAA